MPTQLQNACEGLLTRQMHAVALKEKCIEKEMVEQVAKGYAVLPSNNNHSNLEPEIVGRKFRTKVNANIGRSAECSSIEIELKKLENAILAGADFIMDLSVGSNLKTIRHELIKACPKPFGTVPIYEAVSRLDGNTLKISRELLLDVVTEQAEQGVDFMTIHAGILKNYVPIALQRRAGIVSRGGAILAEWMITHNRENPFYENFDELLKICAKYDVTISLGDGLRPGCLADAGDTAQFSELNTLAELVKSCRKAGVQVMVEGPGHVPFNKIEEQIKREADLCDNAPFYVLGPVVTDLAAGYDHISASIGATAAATAGASLLCYVTAAEHLGLPTPEEVYEGVIAFKIAAHAADIAKGIPDARNRDDAMTDARVAFDWEKQFQIALDGKKARARFEQNSKYLSSTKDHCTMCGASFCAMKISKRLKK
jgi:phosphomethylpyrimidine synthase